MAWTRLRVPASSANLGPGFDALGLALAIYLECRFRLADRLTIKASGCDADSIPTDPTNLIWQTALRIAERAAVPLPSIELEIENSIPLGKGLGSSAAALVSGVVIASHLLDLRWSRHRILAEAAQLEGHPDNVAACVLGGIAVSAMDDAGHACAIRLELPPDCALAIVLPQYALPTTQSRAVLPGRYSQEDVVFNLQRAGLLVAAFATGRTEFLSTALSDRLHQPFRAHLIAGLADVLALRADGLFGCVLSGAGPSILVFYQRGNDAALLRIMEIMERCGQTATVVHTAVSLTGYEIEPL